MIGAVLALTVASASPSPAPTPHTAGDPCGSIISIVTRPTVTTSVCTVRPHRVLLENGYTNTVTTGSEGGTTASYPQSYLRFGSANPHIEFDVTPPSESRSSVGGSLADGSTDTGLGMKYELGYSARWIYGINGAVTFPTGTKAFSAGNPQYTGNFNWSYTVNSVIGLAGTVGFNAFSGLSSSGLPQSYFAIVPSFLVTASLPGSPSELFAEYVYYSQAGVGLGDKHLFDFGYERDLGDRVQLDAEYGFSPTPLAGQRQRYVGAGASFML